MHIGISFDGFAPYGEALSFAREAVGAGAKSLWMADHLGYREAIVSCTGFAGAAPGVKVVPTAVSPYLRHPMPTAMQMATLAEAAFHGGRGNAALAVATGNPLFLAESGEAIDKPVRVIREYVEALRALWSGEPVTMEAMRFRLAGARMMFKPPAPIPVLLCPMKPQMLTLSGKIGDGVVLSAGLSTGFVTESLKPVRAGAAEAGRDYDALTVAGYISFMASADGRTAVDKVREKLAFMFRNRNLDDNIAHSGLPLDQEAIIAAMSKRDYAAAGKLISDDVVEAFAVAGTVRHCCERLEQYERAGMQEVVLLLAGDATGQRAALDVIREFK